MWDYLFVFEEHISTYDSAEHKRNKAKEIRDKKNSENNINIPKIKNNLFRQKAIPMISIEK